MPTDRAVGALTSHPSRSPHSSAQARLTAPARAGVSDRVYAALSGIWWPLLAAALSVVAWQPFLRPDFDLWRADDGEYHLLRVYVFEAAVRAGEWLPRWIPDLFVGYGYPIFNFYAPGTYYLAMALRALGLDVFTTVQVEGALAACVGAAGACCLARAVFGGRVAGLVAALAYVYAPYPFITNLLIRADLAEALGLALLPWTLLAAWEAGRQPGRGRVGALAMAMGAQILTHNLTALVALPAALAVGLFSAARSGAGAHRAGLAAAASGAGPSVPGPLAPSRPARPGAGLAAVTGGLALGLLLTAFFWLPALAEQREVQIEIALESGHKSPRTWLIDPLGSTEQTRRAGNPQTPAGPLDLHLSYPYNLNKPPKPSQDQGALLAAAMALAGLGLAARRRGAAEALFFTAGTLALWFMTTTWSAWLWERVSLLRFLQFSWRLYGPLALSLGLAAAGGAAIAGSWLDQGGKRAGAGRAAGWARAAAVATAVPPALVALLALNTTTARPLWLSDRVERRAGGPQLVGTENALFGAGTTTGGEFVPRAADLRDVHGRRRGNGVYEALYPEFGWIAGRVWVLDGTMQVTGVAGGPTWTQARIAAATPGTIAFRTIAFPGWRAYLDGRPVPWSTAPRDQETGVSPGFITVAVPAGEHEVQIAFGPTALRSAAAGVSVAALAWFGWWLARAGRPGGRRWRMAVALAPAACFAATGLHDVVRPALGAPVQPSPSQERIVADLAALVAGGEAQISSPTGAGLGPFVNLQRLSLGGRERRWLYMHPPSAVSVSLLLPERAAFQVGLALDPRTWEADGADGVRFILEATPAGGRTTRVFEEEVNPRARQEQRTWLDRWVDLSALSGQRVTLTLRTEPGQSAAYDWAGWADPVVFVQRDARRPGGGPPGPVPTPRAT